MVLVTEFGNAFFFPRGSSFSGYHCDCHLTSHFKLWSCVFFPSPAWASAAGIPRSPEPPSKVLANTKTPLPALAKPSSFQNNHFTENIPEHIHKNTNTYKDPTTKRKRRNYVNMLRLPWQPWRIQRHNLHPNCRKPLKVQPARRRMPDIKWVALYTVIIASTNVPRYNVSMFQFNRTKF